MTPLADLDRAAHRRGARRGAAARPRAAARRAAGARPLHARQPHAEPRLRRPARPSGRAEAALRQTSADRRDLLHLPAGEARDRPPRDAADRPLGLDRPRLQDPRARGRGEHRGEDGDRPGVHGVRLSARVDRPRVHRRRPGDADRLRSRGDRGRAPDPPAGHLQARRARRATTSGSATAPASCAG